MLLIYISLITYDVKYLFMCLLATPIPFLGKIAFKTFPPFGGASLVGSDSKESACNVRDSGSILGSGRSPQGGNGYPLLYSCLENSMDRGTWRATVPGVAKNWIRLNN